MALSIGQEAPDFTLVDTDKNEVTLSEQLGEPIVLFFFPLAFTGVCTAELCSVRDDMASYSSIGAKVYGISVDSPFVLEKFKVEQNLNFPLLSDFNSETSARYGARYDDFVLGMKNVSKRSAFVIDAEGKIRYAEVLESAGDLPNFDAVKATLAELGATAG